MGALFELIDLMCCYCGLLVVRLAYKLFKGVIMNINKVELPSKTSCRLDVFIDKSINETAEISGTLKTQVIRTLFNLGLNTFFVKGAVPKLSDSDLSSLINKSKLNKIVHKISEPMNCKLTVIQVEDLNKTELVKHMALSQAIRLVFHIGISELNEKYNEKIKPIKDYCNEEGREMLQSDIFNAYRDLVHFNCFDKV